MYYLSNGTRSVITIRVRFSKKIVEDHAIKPGEVLELTDKEFQLIEGDKTQCDVLTYLNIEHISDELADTNKEINELITAAILSLGRGTPVSLPPDQANQKGVSLEISSADHVHNIPTAVPVDIIPDSGTQQGTASSFARSDHQHKVDAGTAVTLDGDTTNAEGTSTEFSRADHEHGITTGVPAIIQPDLSSAEGTSAAMARANHVHGFTTAAPTTNLSGNTANQKGTATSFSRSDHEHAVDTGTPSAQTPDQANAEGTSANLARADHIHNIPAAVATGLDADSTSIEGVATSFARSDHEHAIADAPVGDMTTVNAGDSAGAGTSANFARGDHEHAVATGTPSAQTPDQANAEGVSTSLARADHVHNIPAASAIGMNADSTSAEGTNASFARSDHTHDLATGTPSAQTPDQTNAEGTSANLARADHIHNIPAASAVGLNANSTSAEGSASSFARSDHEHAIADAPVGDITDVNAGDTTSAGTSTNFARGDHEHAVATAAPSTQTPDQANAEGTSTSLARADHVHNVPAATPVNVGTANAEGTAADFSRSDHVHGHGQQTLGNLHDAATQIKSGFMSSTDKTALDNFIASKGQPNGLASLDSGGQVPSGQLPLELMELKGNWNASTNTPTLANTDTVALGNVYKVSVVGSVDFGAGSISFGVGDWVYNDGSIWDRAGGTAGAVTSVFTRTGAVVAQSGDYSHSEIADRDVTDSHPASAISIQTYSGPGTSSIANENVKGAHTGIHSVGIAVGGDYGKASESSSTTIDVSAGACYIRPTNNASDTLEYLEWAAHVNVDVSSYSSGDVVFVWFDYTNGATVQHSTTDPDSSYSDQTVIKIGDVHIGGSGIAAVHDHRSFIGNHAHEFTHLHRDVFRKPVNELKATEVHGTRELQITSGKVYRPGFNNIDIGAFDSTSGGGDTFTYYYRDGSGGWTRVAAQTVLDNDKYDDGTGTLATLETGKWKKDWIFISDTGSVFVVYGQDQYNNELVATGAEIPVHPWSHLVNYFDIVELATYHKEKEAEYGKIIDIATRFPTRNPDAKYMSRAPRNYSGIEYFTLIHSFHAAAEAHVEQIRARELLNNAYIDTFNDDLYIQGFFGIVVDGSSAILALNPLYSSESAVIQDFETPSQLSRCALAECKIQTWKDSDLSVDPTTYGGGLGISAISGTNIGRIARGADPGGFTNYWTCMKLGTAANVDANTASINFSYNIPTGTFPAGLNIPLTAHLIGSSGEDFYGARILISADTGSSWVKASFNVEACTFLATVAEVAISFGKDVANTQDAIIYIEDVTVSGGVIRTNRGYFERTDLTTTHDIIESYTGRKFTPDSSVGTIANHLSLDGGAHYKLGITIGQFLSAEAGGELETPNHEYKSDITLTQQAITFQYNMPSGDDNLKIVHIYKGTDSKNTLAESTLMFRDDFETDTTTNYIETGLGTFTHDVGNERVDIVLGGVSRVHHALLSVTNGYDSDMFVEVKVILEDNVTPGTISSYQTAGVALRTATATNVGYWAGLHHNGTTFNFVLGEGLTVVQTGTFTPTAGTEYTIYFSVLDDGANVELSARLFNSTSTVLHETLTYTDTATIIATGDIAIFAGTVGGNGVACKGSFDHLSEYYGYGEYHHKIGTPDYVEFIPGREPAVAIKGNYLKPFIGSWDNKQSLRILASFQKNVMESAQDDTPEIDDFIQIAKITET